MINLGTVSVVKKCADEHPSQEGRDHCIQVETGGVESVICACNSTPFCNSQSEVDRLLQEHGSLFTHPTPSSEEIPDFWKVVKFIKM